MPITTKHGSIFDSRAQVLVCPVNCVGVMGKGLALEFKRRFPIASKWHIKECKGGRILPGSVTANRRGLLFAATKDDWRNPSKIEWVNACLVRLVIRANYKDFQSIALPQLGCGCGGLDWADVEPLVEKHLGGLDCDVEVWICE